MAGIKRVSSHVCSRSWSRLKSSRAGVINDYCPLLSSTESESVLTLLPELPPVSPSRRGRCKCNCRRCSCLSGPGPGPASVAPPVAAPVAAHGRRRVAN